jgi:hypothetical protein
MTLGSLSVSFQRLLVYSLDRGSLTTCCLSIKALGFDPILQSLKRGIDADLVLTLGAIRPVLTCVFMSMTVPVSWPIPFPGTRPGSMPGPVSFCTLCKSVSKNAFACWSIHKSFEVSEMSQPIRCFAGWASCSSAINSASHCNYNSHWETESTSGWGLVDISPNWNCIGILWLDTFPLQTYLILWSDASLHRDVSSLVTFLATLPFPMLLNCLQTTYNALSGLACMSPIKAFSQSLQWVASRK